MPNILRSYSVRFRREKNPQPESKFKYVCCCTFIMAFSVPCVPCVPVTELTKMIFHILINTNNLSIFSIFSRKWHKGVNWNFHMLAFVHISGLLWSMDACTNCTCTYTLPLSLPKKRFVVVCCSILSSSRMKHSLPTTATDLSTPLIRWSSLVTSVRLRRNGQTTLPRKIYLNIANGWISERTWQCIIHPPPRHTQVVW